jgi:hypothetical protein
VTHPEPAKATQTEGVKAEVAAGPAQAEQQPEPTALQAAPETGAEPPVVPPSTAFNPFNPNGKRGRREWTPEQRAEQAERARNRHKDRRPFDSDMEAVKAEFESGLSLDRIGGKYHCSGSHIRNFLIKHGIDPRRTGTSFRNGGRSEFTEEEIQIIIDKKAKGTPSEVIGKKIDRTPHVVDVKYSQLKKEGRVPEEHLTPEALADRKQHQNEIVSEKMKEYHAGKHAGREPRLGGELIESIKRLVANGLSDVEIGKQYDVGSQTVADFRRRHGIKKRQGWHYQTKRRSTRRTAVGFLSRAVATHH